MYQVIALKFRPQRFEDVVGQDHVTRVIKNGIDSGRMPHAFIFSGPRGVGKTSVARILAKCLNCEKGPTSTPCNECRLCREITASRAVDVFEVDAASHTGVDNIRELIENARYAPAMSRYKVFIIDEVHMLSKSAFNALLKTLEEPPSHVVFIMATTEVEKIPLTVLSRCQRYEFRRIGVDDIVSQLRHISSLEGLKVTDDAMMTIALQADGSMRDAQSIMEHLASFGKEEIDVDSVEEILGIIDHATLRSLLKAIVDRDAIEVIKLIDRVYKYGKDLTQLYKTLLEQFRNMMLLKLGYTELAIPLEDKSFLMDLVESIPFEEIHRLLSVLIHSEDDLKYSMLPRITVETILLRIVSAPRLADLARVIDVISSGKVPTLPEVTIKPSPKEPGQYKKPIDGHPRLWEGFISYLKDHDHPLYAVLSESRLVSENEGVVVLSVSSSFLANQVNRMLPDVTKRAQGFFNRDIKIEIRLEDGGQEGEDKPTPSEIRTKAMKSQVVREVLSQFNGVIRDVKPKK